MDNISVKLPKIEQIPIKLRDLYERFGYTKYRMAKFEPYDFYREHKGFLKSEGILTFNGPKGKLLALKPDVTMSIAKSVKKDKEYKYFYVENVYRTDGGEYNEINQIGIEYIGGVGEYPCVEVLYLACRTLDVISQEYVLSIGHAGVWNACFEYLNLTEQVKSEVLAKIKNKSLHEVDSILKNCGVSEKGVNLVHSLASISDEISVAVNNFKSITKNLPFEDISNELTCLADALKEVGVGNKCRLDFSVTGDLTYYNGIVFNGYVCGVAKTMLSGGRYDNLLKSLDKDHNAIGFAVYTEELQRAFASEKVENDCLIKVNDYSAKDAIKKVVQAVDEGLYVKAVTEVENA